MIGVQLDLFFLVAAVLGVLIAGISKGGFGGGAGFVATPIMALAVDPGIAVGVMLPLLMVMDVTSLRAYWGRWSRSDAARMILGAVPGILIAAAIYRLTDPDVFRFLIGVIAVSFVAFQIGVRRGWVTPRAEPLGAAAGLGSGVVVGFTSFISHAGGPPALVYLLSQRLTKTVFQATTVAVFSVVNLMKAVIYGGIGIFTAETLTLSLMLAPIALVGALIGVKAHHRVPERLFFGLTYVLLAGAGTKLIWDALA